MTIRDMLDSGIVLEGHVRIQTWDNNTDCPTIYFNNDFGYMPLDNDYLIYMDYEITYIFPCMFGRTAPALCIEVTKDN